MSAEDLSDFLKGFSTHKPESKAESWDSYFMRLAYQVRERSSCHHRKVGALIVRENRILSTGYNQPPSGFPHCDETECIRDALGIPSGQNQEICYAAHAEQNAIAQAAKFGIATNGSTIYVTHRPCSICARLIINAGIKRVVFSEGYPDPLTEFMFEKTNVTMTQFTK
ncbi:MULTISPECIES: dCMP deaminase family protein [Mesotoga]|jgi:dCMP deaminase|uniref:deoxycytidylate deaminase n=1 Tax=Mesotoga TaxID=1184396 RepID=UPI0002CA5FF3|nr:MULTISPECIES: dCMP deaminase family protein [Mesotoga]MCP5456806.1 dCMP deaminase family protein [Thermotogota bacterium]CCU86097.1 CMP/dCMP deaminase zinc-binding [Mesotoga infera]MCP5460983.1 dCMP deaminase family protein [Thermotogota bacterium]MDK2943596.1 dCMP deaminase [Mesotoga sp.]RLL87913.1 deoxycytidylate deaminase [Mesotoga sp. H07pep.5.4]